MEPWAGGVGRYDGWRWSSNGFQLVVLGSVGTCSTVFEKSKADVRSPATERRHGVMLGSLTPKRDSMSRMTDVWSKTSELSQPPVLHGDTTNIGTRGPIP
jgi:hypothetical protein